MSLDIVELTRMHCVIDKQRIVEGNVIRINTHTQIFPDKALCFG